MEETTTSVIPPAPAGEMQTTGQTKTVRLSVIEKAYARGMVALRDGRYREADIQFSGLIKLAEEVDSELTIVQQTLRLLLAIREEIAILEAKAD